MPVIYRSTLLVSVNDDLFSISVTPPMLPSIKIDNDGDVVKGLNQERMSWCMVSEN